MLPFTDDYFGFYLNEIKNLEKIKEGELQQFRIKRCLDCDFYCLEETKQCVACGGFKFEKKEITD